jgi:hypothetical protein
MLGSFRGAIAAAQSRMKALQATAASVGKSIAKFGALFSTLFAGAAVFGVGAVFKKLFEGADEAAAAAEQRTRKLTAALYAQNRIRAKGRDYAVAQTKELQQGIGVLAKQGVYSAGMLESAAGVLALQKLGPKEIMKTLPALEDVLVATQGINASQEDLNALALGFGKAIRTGTVPRSMMRYIGSLTVAEKKLLQAKAKAGDLQGAYDFLMEKMARFSGETARALKTPEGRIKSLDIAMASMRRHIGEASLEARAKLADTWKALLPEIEPYLIAAKKLSAEAMISVANFVKKYGVPALKAISAWAKGPGAEAWERMKKAWGEMAGKIGKALGDQFKALAGNGATLGDVVVKAMDAIGKAMKWVGDNANWIIPALEGLAIALGAIVAFGAITTNINVIGVAAAVAAIGIVTSEYQKFKDLQEGLAVSDPEHFTKHWYLMGQTWTEVFAGLTGVVESFKAGWHKSIDELKAKWDWLVNSIKVFKMPAWWDRFWSKQTEGAKANADVLEAQRKIEEQADFARRGAYKPKVFSFFEDPKEVAAAADVVRGTQAAMLARPTEFGRGPKEPLLPPLARAMREQAILPLAGMEKSVNATSDAVTAALMPAVSDVTLQFGLLSEMLAGITGVGGAAGGGVAGIGGVGGAAGAAALAPISEAMNNLPMTPEAKAAIEAERSDFVKELQRPEMQNLVSATLSTEMSSAEGQKDVLEALVNRAVAYRRAGKYKGMEQMIKGGFYGPYNRGVTNAVMRSGLTPEREAQVASMIEEIKTRNVLRGMTDQGVNVGRRTYVHGEGYSYGHGVATAAYQGAKAAAAAAPETPEPPPLLKAMAAGGVVTRPTLAMIGEKGPEAVTPLSRAGAHSTSVNFAPNITIHGNATATEQATLDSKLRSLAKDFVADFKRAQNNERRLSYEGGYG